MIWCWCAKSFAWLTAPNTSASRLPPDLKFLSRPSAPAAVFPSPLKLADEDGLDWLKKFRLLKGTHASFAALLQPHSAAGFIWRGPAEVVFQIQGRACPDPHLQHPASFGGNGERFHEADVWLRSIGIVEDRNHPSVRGRRTHRSAGRSQQLSGTAE